MYDIVIVLYAIGVALAGIFREKPRKMLLGGLRAFRELKGKLDPGARYLWFHASSLGEFEQGRPIIERLRKERPEYRILLTFFSPSGYEVRKNYEGADIVCYLPLDVKPWARRFLSLARPEMAFFIKYEFWWNYLSILKGMGVPTYSVSSIFRPSQVFFRWYGRGYRRVLGCFTGFFVQNEASRRLLAGLGLGNVEVTGDTRFDRVLEIRGRARRPGIVEAFCRGSKVFVAGSSWRPDEEIFTRYLNAHRDWKLIVAPHLIGEDRLRQVESLAGEGTVRYTRATEKDAERARCLVIDCFGLLSSIYAFGDVTYVGGGFGAGIHNLLEAAAWGKPVIFGPNNGKFQEARDLLVIGGGHQIGGYDDFERLMDSYASDAALMAEDGRKAGAYVEGRAGATDRIVSRIFPGAPATATGRGDTPPEGKEG